MDDISDAKAKDVKFTVFVKIYPFQNEFCSVRIILVRMTSLLLASAATTPPPPKTAAKPKKDAAKPDPKAASGAVKADPADDLAGVIAVAKKKL